MTLEDYLVFVPSVPRLLCSILRPGGNLTSSAFTGHFRPIKMPCTRVSQQFSRLYLVFSHLGLLDV